MADTGVKYPTNITTQSVSPESNDNWVSPNNIKADDGSNASITAATFDSPDISYRLKAQGFDFSVIPDGASILGILVEIKRYNDTGETGKDYRVQLLDGNGNLVGDNKAIVGNWETTPTVKSYGGSGDLWNAYPTSGMVKSANFGVVLSTQATVANADIYVDYIRILIYYAEHASVGLRSVGQSPGANSDSCVIVKPVGLTVGDLMVAQVVGRDFLSPDSAFTAPANWTSIRQDAGGSGLLYYIRVALFWKIADAGDVAATNFTFTATNAVSNRGTITAWTGHDPTTPINANNGQYNTASTTVTSPEITPSVANCMICLFCGIQDNYTQSDYAIATSNPASWSEAYDLPSDLTYDLGLSLGYALRPETTATGNGTATISSSKSNTGQLVAIAPLSFQTYNLSCTDGFKVGDSPTHILKLYLTITDGLGVGDVLSTLANLNVLTTDGLKIGDLTTIGLVIQALASDGMKFSDSAVMGFVYALLASDGIKLSDLPNTTAVLNSLVTDGIKLGDTATTQVILNALASDGVKIGDAPTIYLTLPALATDGLKIGDTPTTRAIFNILTADGMKLSEALVTAISFNMLAQDGLKLSDVPVIIKVLNLSLADGLKLSEALDLTIWVWRLISAFPNLREIVSAYPKDTVAGGTLREIIDAAKKAMEAFDNLRNLDKAGGK